MGWFDKRSWRLRRKIKDLQTDLRTAEEEGKFIVQDGLFFAELQDMGEVTMMAFGTNLLAAEEENVIRSFFDRNGFIVDTLKLDKTYTALAEVEIIPAEEMIRSVARELKGEGYKLVDDSDKELAPNLNAKILTLSAVMRAMTLLFSERVQKTIATTRVKMNKEGNRLLHWLPKIIEVLENKVDRFTTEIIRPGFDVAYEEFYGALGKSESQGKSTKSAPARSADPDEPLGMIPPVEAAPRLTAAPSAVPPSSPAKRRHSIDDTPTAPQPSISAPPPPQPAALTPPTARKPSTSETNALLARDAAEAKARMYRALVGANASRCLKNSEALLNEIIPVMRASAVCLLTKMPGGDSLAMHVQAGDKLTWGEGEGLPISTTVVMESLRRRTIVTHASGPAGQDSTGSMIMNRIDAAAAVPVQVDGEIIAILYIDRRNQGNGLFTEAETSMIENLIKPFEDFPDLTLATRR